MREMNVQLPPRIGKAALGNFAILFHSDSFDIENVDVEMGFLLANEGTDTFTLTEGQVLTPRNIPAIDTMATMVCVGLAHHVSSYGALGTWIEKHNFRLAGPSWEIFIEPFQAGKEDEAVIEVQLPVTKIGNTPEFHHLIKS
jgi:effector-binding domain-containing protein